MDYLNAGNWKLAASFTAIGRHSHSTVRVAWGGGAIIKPPLVRHPRIG
jgi:hypothetical protein